MEQGATVCRLRAGNIRLHAYHTLWSGQQHPGNFITRIVLGAMRNRSTGPSKSSVGPSCPHIELSTWRDGAASRTPPSGACRGTVHFQQLTEGPEACWLSAGAAEPSSPARELPNPAPARGGASLRCPRLIDTRCRDLRPPPHA